MAEPATVDMTPTAAAMEPKGPRMFLMLFMTALDGVQQEGSAVL